VKILRFAKTVHCDPLRLGFATAAVLCPCVLAVRIGIRKVGILAPVVKLRG
jgi:hypothetical protein